MHVTGFLISFSTLLLWVSGQSRSRTMMFGGCSYGMTGFCTEGFACRPGSSCRFSFRGSRGVCCMDRPLYEPLPQRCQYGRRGVCGGIGGIQCPPGSTCQSMGDFPDAMGTCCNNKPVEEKCKHGEQGICGGIAGFTCPKGTTCQFMQPFADGAGKCCIDRPEEVKCKFGQDGVCGGIAGLSCKNGYTCRDIPTDIADGFGKCCKTSPEITIEKGVCPPPSPFLGICVFDINRNCLGDEYCPSGHLCCHEGCGRVCKEALMPEIPGPHPTPDGNVAY